MDLYVAPSKSIRSPDGCEVTQLTARTRRDRLRFAASSAPVTRENAPFEVLSHGRLWARWAPALGLAVWMLLITVGGVIGALHEDSLSESSQVRTVGSPGEVPTLRVRSMPDTPLRDGDLKIGYRSS